MHISEGFASFLAARLAKDNSLRVHHISTPPISCSPLFAPGPGHSAQNTWCESHFLAISQKSVTDPDASPSLLVLGLEVLIFTTENLTTIFVSKADSTGYLIRQPGPTSGSSVAFATTSAFLEFLVIPRLTRSRLVLSLFARSQNQYLFPGSIENVSKRILDDRQLIKWWCRVLDPIVRAKLPSTEASISLHTKAYIVVPGCEKAETKAFFPPSARHDQLTEAKWINQYPFAFLSHDASLPPRCLVPRLPDDPKARFLEDLDGIQVNHDGSWKGVKSLDQFWEMMSYRQECSAGRLVGFIWATFSQPDREASNPQSADAAIPHGKGSDDASLPAETSQANAASERDMPSVLAEVKGPPTKPPPKPAQVIASQGNVILHEEGLEQGTTASETSGVQPPLSWPEQSRGEVVLSSEQYSTLMDYMLQLDFAGEDTAKKSTKDWIDKAKDAAGTSNFGVDVIGTYVADDTARAEILAVPTANILTAVRKKRKADVVPVGELAERTTVNTLSLDSMRKKPKA